MSDSSSDEGMALAPELEVPGPEEGQGAPAGVSAPSAPPLGGGSSDSGDSCAPGPAPCPRIMSAARLLRARIPGRLHPEGSSSATPSGRSSGHRTSSSSDDQDPAHPQYELLSGGRQSRPVAPAVDYRRQQVGVSTYFFPPASNCMNNLLH
jgi:hypothetical protein